MTERSLLLLRHAKSSWDDPSLDDFDRPLAKRGREVAPRIAKEMAQRGWQPDHALISPALRTRQTWELVAAALPHGISCDFVPAIYEAPAARILEAVRSAPDEAGCLLVVGHNPGLEELSALIASPESNDEAMARLSAKFPTAAIARFGFGGPWQALGPGTAIFKAFVTPKELG
ncbi:MAG: histidine phosphatase family protein [Mesorhizobium sp.]|nr:histidine phosphatase family protein [Mesorhizobium sp.]